MFVLFSIVINTNNIVRSGSTIEYKFRKRIHVKQQWSFCGPVTRVFCQFADSNASPQQPNIVTPGYSVTRFPSSVSVIIHALFSRKITHTHAYTYKFIHTHTQTRRGPSNLRKIKTLSSAAAAVKFH